MRKSVQILKVYDLKKNDFPKNSDPLVSREFFMERSDLRNYSKNKLFTLIKEHPKIQKYLKALSLDIESKNLQEEWQVLPSGKPFFKTLPLFFNISHSQEKLALAVSTQGEIGLDVQKIYLPKNWERIIKRYFTSAEADYIFNQAEGNRPKSFTEIWAIKEAIIKKNGGKFLTESKGINTVPPPKNTKLYYLENYILALSFD